MIVPSVRRSVRPLLRCRRHVFALLAGPTTERASAQPPTPRPHGWYGHRASPQSGPHLRSMISSSRRSRERRRSRLGLARREAARELVRPAGALPDPMVSLGWTEADYPVWSLGREPMSSMSVGVQQALPYPGKRRARRRAAEADVAARDKDVASLRSAIVADVRRLYARLLHDRSGAPRAGCRRRTARHAGGDSGDPLRRGTERAGAARQGATRGLSGSASGSTTW